MVSTVLVREDARPVCAGYEGEETQETRQEGHQHQHFDQRRGAFECASQEVTDPVRDVGASGCSGGSPLPLVRRHL